MPYQKLQNKIYAEEKKIKVNPFLFGWLEEASLELTAARSKQEICRNKTQRTECVAKPSGARK